MIGKTDFILTIFAGHSNTQYSDEQIHKMIFHLDISFTLKLFYYEAKTPHSMELSDKLSHLCKERFLVRIEDNYKVTKNGYILAQEKFNLLDEKIQIAISVLSNWMVKQSFKDLIYSIDKRHSQFFIDFNTN